jgi:hypothetical protein
MNRKTPLRRKRPEERDVRGDRGNRGAPTALVPPSYEIGFVDRIPAQLRTGLESRSGVDAVDARQQSHVDAALADRGRPLEADVASTMAARFGRGFADVRLHSGPSAAAAAAAVNAKAFTLGAHIVVADPQFSPRTVDGQRLLAHELAHVVQQRDALVPSQPAVARAHGEPERQARQAGEAVAAGRPAPPLQRVVAAAIQREEKEGDRAQGHEGVQHVAPARLPRAAKTGDVEQRITQLESEVKRSQNRDRALFHLNSFRDQVLKRATGWERAALRVGSAYALAADTHRTVLEARAKAEALENQAMFSVLTIATAGGLSWLSWSLQARNILKEGELLTSVLEDTMQATGGEAFSAIGVQIATPEVAPVSDNPQVFQNERLDRILSARESALAYFAAASDAFRLAPPAFWDTYSATDQTTRFEKWLSHADLLKGDEHLPDVGTMAYELERGFWARWVQGLAVRALGYTASIFGYGKKSKDDLYNLTVYTKPGAAVEDRLIDLGIAREAGIESFGKWTSEDEIDKLAAWGRTYRMKPFISD